MTDIKTVGAHTPGPWAAWSPISTGSFNPQGAAFVVGPTRIMMDKSFGFSIADANLIAAAPDFYESQAMGAQMNTPDFLDWMADRLVSVYGESPAVDFVLSLRSRADAGRKAIAKARGEA